MITPHLCNGLDGMPTVLCFDRQSFDLMNEEQATIERMSKPIRIILVGRDANDAVIGTLTGVNAARLLSA